MKKNNILLFILDLLDVKYTKIYARKYYEEHPEIVDESLRIGTERAQNVAKQNMKRIKEKMKINYFDK